MTGERLIAATGNGAALTVAGTAGVLAAAIGISPNDIVVNAAEKIEFNYPNAQKVPAI